MSSHWLILTNTLFLLVSPLERAYEKNEDRKDGEEEEDDMEGEELCQEMEMGEWIDASTVKQNKLLLLYLRLCFLKAVYT